MFCSVNQCLAFSSASVLHLSELIDITEQRFIPQSKDTYHRVFILTTEYKMLWLVLLSCLLVHCEYEHYNLSSLCAHPGSAVSLYLGVQESVFSVNSPHAGVEDCHLQLRVFSHTFGQAVFIKKMRSDSCDSHFLQFGG